jgi:hypothetical protein
VQIEKIVVLVAAGKLLTDTKLLSVLITVACALMLETVDSIYISIVLKPYKFNLIFFPLMCSVTDLRVCATRTHLYILFNNVSLATTFI